MINRCQEVEASGFKIFDVDQYLNKIKIQIVILIIKYNIVIKYTTFI